MKDVKVDYHTWKDNDPMGPSDKIVDLCDFRIEVSTPAHFHLYAGRRAKLMQYCDDFKSAWKKLTLNEEHICFDGETLTKGEPEFDEKTQKMMTVWTWDKIATRKGCYSFWAGYDCTDF